MVEVNENPNHAAKQDNPKWHTAEITACQKL